MSPTISNMCVNYNHILPYITTTPLMFQLPTTEKKHVSTSHKGENLLSYKNVCIEDTIS